MTSMGLIISGIVLLLLESVFEVKLEPLVIFDEKFPAGWACCIIGLAIQLIDRLPMIAEVFKGSKK